MTGGLITVGVFALWIRTVVVGLMAAHFSPRTLLIFLDDRFQRNLLAFISAGIVTVLVILLRMPTGEQAPVPLVSTVLAVIIALAAMAGVLLAIQHATRSLSLPELVTLLAEEFAWRKQHGFPVRWLNSAALKDEYGLTAPAAILSSVAAIDRTFRFRPAG